ncbi:MAG: radical SAM protein [Planctomycetes bacterium]|nr:radical SAM protein [Planctomycetota bacterium]
MRLRDWATLTPVFVHCLGKLSLRHLWYLGKQFRNENPHPHDGKLYVNTFFPPYPSKAFDKFLASVIDRKRVPYSTYFAVTDKCPYRCAHCSYGMHEKGTLDTETAIGIIKQIVALGTVTLGFTGGEPLTRPDIAELVAATGDETASILFTTGHRLNVELAKKLKEAQLGCLTVGIESDERDEHDSIRGGSGSFDEALAAIETSLKAGIYTAISTVGIRHKIVSGKIERIAGLAEKLGVHEFRILEPIPTGSFTGETDEVLTRAESERLSNFHKQHNRQNRGPAISSFSYLESNEMFGCGAGFHHLFVDAVGNVCPCDLTPLSFGNILEEPLADIWSNMGTIFSLPRCGCMMKEISKNGGEIKPGCKLPLEKQESVAMCKKLCPGKKLPAVYENLFRGQKLPDRELIQK